MPTKRLLTIISHPKFFTHGNPCEILVTSAVGTGGSTFDHITTVQDITGDGIIPVEIIKSHPNAGQANILKYSAVNLGSGFNDPFASSGFPAGVQVSMREIKVFFQSGHFETFTIPLSVRNWYSYPSPLFNFNMAGTIGSYLLVGEDPHMNDYKNTHVNASVDPITGIPIHNFYSMSDDYYGTLGGVTGNPNYEGVIQSYAKFTKYSGAGGGSFNIGPNTNNFFSASEILTKVTPGTNCWSSYVKTKVSTSFAQADGPPYSSHNDWIANMYGVNGYTTPDAFNSGRQEWHRVDFLLQDNNLKWHGDLGIVDGVLMDINQLETKMANKVLSDPLTASTYNCSNLAAFYSKIDPQVLIGAYEHGNEIWDSLHDNVMTWTQAFNIATAGADDPNFAGSSQHFVYRIYFADNLPNPNNPVTYTFTVCDNSGSANYYLTTSKDCSGQTIPAANLPGGVDHAVTTFIPNNSCCGGCSLQNDIRTGSLANGPGCVSFGTTDGVIEVDTSDPAWTSNTNTGNPWSSGSTYTFNLSLSNGASITQTMPPTGGNTTTVANCVTNTTSGTEHEITCPSSSLISPYMQVSGAGIPTGAYVGQILTGTAGNNVTKFTIVDIVGNTLLATAAATVTLTFAAGHKFYFGNLAPNTGALGSTHYILSVTDEDGCSIETLITLCEADEPEGCTDNTAINYNSTAVIDDGSCLLCDAVTGQLEDVNGNDIGDLFTNTTVTVVDTTLGTSTGSITVSTNVAAAFQAVNPATGSPYIDIGTSHEQYKVELYQLTTPGDPSTAGALLLQDSLQSSTFGYNPVKTWTSRPYGHYATKVYLVDTNTVSEAEECFTWIFATVRVPVCDDPNSTHYDTTVPADFRIPDISLCTTNCPQPHIELAAIDDGLTTIPPRCNGNPPTFNPNATECCPEPVIYIHYGSVWNSLFPACAVADSVVPDPFSQPHIQHDVWLFNGVPIANQTTSVQPGATDLSGYGVGVSKNFGTTANPNSSGEIGGPGACITQQLGTGTYTLEVYRELVDGTICMASLDVLITVPNDGCLDPASINYNPNATCPGACLYETYDCDPVTGVCFDPGTGQGPYATLMDCQANCVPVGIDGCTDPCAINYDPAATTDDGTCEYKACLDSAASNFEYSCDCGINIPTATINDQACCTFTCQDLPTVTITTTDATGTCTSLNADGQVTFNYQSTNGSTNFNVQIYSGLPVSANLIYSYVPDVSTTPAPDGSTNTLTSLATGTYTIVFTDMFGCEHEEIFAISGPGITFGCTDPLASNYSSTATCDDGSCIYCGCTDPLAINYDPSAMCDDGSCLYRDEKNPCIPRKLKKAIVTLKACLAQKGSEWLTEYKIGTNVDCSTMNKWKLILLGYVLKAQKSENGFGLGCLFNCADKGTPNIEDVILNCNDLWVTGAAFTGLNDAATNGASILGSSWTSGEGTTITDPAAYFVSGQKLGLGDVIKMPSGFIYKVVSIATQQLGPHTFDLQDMNPETATGVASGNWTKCSDENYVDITTSVNYYDNFLNFVNKFCEDCNIPPAWKQI